MFNSEEEYILDFIAEEKKPHMALFDVEDIDSDSSTISATEVNSIGCNTPTPPLFCKLRKVRVMMKKLPLDVLEKYNIANKKRSSKRMKGKQIPGKYMSLHVNKPINEIANKRKRLKDRLTAKQAIRLKHRIRSRNRKFGFPEITEDVVKRSLKAPNLAYKNATQPAKIKNSPHKINFSTCRRDIHDKIGTTRKLNVTKNSQPLHVLPDENSSKRSSSFDRRSLHERIAATRVLNKDTYLATPVASTLPNFPDVVITKYQIPSNNFPKSLHKSSILPLSNFKTPYVLNEPLNIPPTIAPTVAPFCAMSNNCVRNSITISSSQHNVAVQVPLPFSTTTSFSNNSHTKSTQSSSNAFPTTITSAHCNQESNSKQVNSTKTGSIIQYHQPSNSTQRKFKVQTFTIPRDLLAKKNPVKADASKVLLINQPSKRNDPLDMPFSAVQENKVSKSQHAGNESNADSDIETCVESETDIELSDAENRIEPEVIKRIIYHTKSVQTKFTCNGSICGLVDSDEFNLNCFYCYDIFPLHKWLEFKEHIKLVHNVVEKRSQLDSDKNIGNSKSHDCNSNNANKWVKNVQTALPSSKSKSDKNIAVNKENFITRTVNKNEQTVKKLPLDPRIVAQRLNITSAEPAKLSPILKANSYKSKQSKQPPDSHKSSCRPLPINNNLNNNCIDEIINLDSDGGDDICRTATKYMQEDKKPTNKYNLNNIISKTDVDTKLVLPTLPHITIKKVEKPAPKVEKAVPLESTKIPQPIFESSLKDSFIKLPSNLNIQQVIKTLPKPKSQQLLANGRIKPRYFVVKKIIKLPTKEAIPNLNISKGVIVTKLSEAAEGNTKNSATNAKALIDEKEDSVPKPTNGRGILFGVTNSMVVIEFLMKLKTIPELWRPQLKSNVSSNYNEGIKKLCFHLNSRFDLNITDLEMRLSIQRVKDWYCNMLKNIHEHNKIRNNTEPYKHKFLLYFKILNQFLTSNVHYTNNFNAVTNMNKYPKCMEYKIETPAPKLDGFHLDEKLPQVKKIKSIPNITDFMAPSEMSAESIIEFDADTLYDHESSGEEILEEFDETKKSDEKINKIEELRKKRTKVYVGKHECDVCHKIYKRRCDLKRHNVLHFPPQFECGVCSQKFYFKHWAEKCAHLRNKKHIKGEHNNSLETAKPKRIWPKKIFRFKMICEICGASYRSIGSLNTHKRDKHLNQREKCVVCNFTALSNWRIVQHQKKRHVVELGTVEEIAKKCRARTDTKTPFSDEARKEFFWRRDMRKKLKPGEKFYGCCKCRIVFNSRKEKVLHNKVEHPIKETTVFCLLCLPNKLLLSNSNCARRHYTDIHKVPWHEIDDLVKRTKPIFNLLSKDEIELVKASENYKELLEELLKNKQLESVQNSQLLEDEALRAIKNLPTLSNTKELDEIIKIDEECSREENVYVDGIIDHDYNNEEMFKEHEYANNNEHNYSEHDTIENYGAYDAVNTESKNELFSHHAYDNGIVHLDYDIGSNDNKIYNIQNDQDYLQSIVHDFEEGELVEESIVVEECIDEVIDGEEEYF